MIFEFVCAACSAVFSFEEDGDRGREQGSPCPLCAGGEASLSRTIRPGEAALTGTYKYSRVLERMVKISDRVSGKKCCGTGSCGSGCSGGCGGC
jgi:hypothetical protein